MLKTAQCREPPTETRASPATVVPIPVCSGWRAAEARMRRLASLDLGDDVAHVDDRAVGELGDGLGGDAARDLARGVASHAVGDDVDGARRERGVLVVLADPSHVGRQTSRDHRKAAAHASPHGVTRTVVRT